MPRGGTPFESASLPARSGNCGGAPWTPSLPGVELEEVAWSPQAMPGLGFRAKGPGHSGSRAQQKGPFLEAKSNQAARMLGGTTMRKDGSANVGVQR